MRLILVRHGETVENAAGILQGQSPGKLSKKGITQAKQAAIKLKNQKIKYVYCSDLRRTKQTAKEITKHVKAPICFIKEIRERNLGVFQRKPRELFRKYKEDNRIDELRFKPKNGESIPELKKRVIKYFRQTLKRHKNDTVLWITHGGVISNLLLHLLKLDHTHYKKVHPENAEIIVIDINQNKIKIKRN